jgi:hypothetical protein
MARGRGQKGEREYQVLAAEFVLTFISTAIGLVGCDDFLNEI